MEAMIKKSSSAIPKMTNGSWIGSHMPAKFMLAIDLECLSWRLGDLVVVWMLRSMLYMIAVIYVGVSGAEVEMHHCLTLSQTRIAQ